MQSQEEANTLESSRKESEMRLKIGETVGKLKESVEAIRREKQELKDNLQEYLTQEKDKMIILLTSSLQQAASIERTQH